MRKAIVAITFTSIIATSLMSTAAQTNSNKPKLETQLKVYGREGHRLYTVNLLPLAPSSISKKRFSFLNQLLSYSMENQLHFVENGKIGFLFRVETPEGSKGGKLDLQSLTLMVKSAEWNLSGKVYRMMGGSDYPSDELKIEKGSTFTGVYVPYDPQLIHLIGEKTDMYIYYKNGGGRVKLKLPEKFFHLK